MIVWQRLGILAFLIPAILYNVFNYVADAVKGPGYSRSHNAPAVASLLLSAILVAGFGFWVSSYSKAISEPKSGWERICRGKHTLFFVPMQYIAILLVVIAIYMTLHQPAGSGN